jgi:MFS family permease
LLGVATLQALATALLLAAVHAEASSRALLLGVSVLLGVARAFQMPASQSLLPQLVPPALLPRAMATGSSGIQLAIIAGPALGGVVYVAGAAAVYGLCLALFAVGALMLLGVPVPARARSNEPTTWRTVLAGVHFIWQRPVLLGAMSLDLFAVLLGGATALLPIFAKDILHVGPWGLGLLRASPAAGAFVMSLWLVRWPVERRVGRWLIGAVALFGLCMVVFGLSTHWLLSLAALLVPGGADMVSVVIRQSLMQLDTPDDMRGRVSAVSAVFIGASNQLGEFESGATAAVLGPVGSAVLGGAGTLAVCALWTRWFPALWRRDRLVEH